MNRKLIYVSSLFVFFLMWGVFGFAGASPRSDSNLPAIVPSVESTPIVSGATNSAGISVTGESEPVLAEIFIFYGLIGLTALFLVLALLTVANKSTAQYMPHKTPPSDKGQGN